jgi:hypothetical protein
MRLMVEEARLTFGQWRRKLYLFIALRELASGATVQRLSGNRSPRFYRNVQESTRHNTGALFRILIGFDRAACFRRSGRL